MIGLRYIRPLFPMKLQQSRQSRLGRLGRTMAELGSACERAADQAVIACSLPSPLNELSLARTHRRLQEMALARSTPHYPFCRGHAMSLVDGEPRAGW